MTKSTGMIVDGVFSSEAVDSSGEIVDLKGMDISDFEEGKGVANYEHLAPGNTVKEGSSASHGQEIVGKIVYAKKIFKESDCENDRQREYWKKVKEIPYLYGVVRLYDGAGHPGAIALAAQIRDHAANGEQILVRYSIEGSTTGRGDGPDSNRVTTSIAKRIAMTLKPCNKTCDAGLVSDPNAPSGFEKEPAEAAKDILELMDKGEIDPQFRPIGGACEIECNPELDEEHLTKTMTGGLGDVAPSAMSGGAALQKEDEGLARHALKNKMYAALRDSGKKNFSKGELREFIKAHLPEASDDFIDHFTDVAADYTAKLRKAEDEAPMKTRKDRLFPLINGGIHQTNKKGQLLYTKGKSSIDKSVHAERIDKKGNKTYTLHQGTAQGVLLKPNPGVKGMVVDENAGKVHMPFGTFDLYNPDADTTSNKKAFHDILNDPKVEEFHNEAMQNWVKVHEHFKNGTLPPEVLMHSVLFSQLSPNTPVPIQELMYSKLIDAMKTTGLDPREPGFENIREPWMDLNKPDIYPEHSKEYFEKHPGVHVGGKAFTEGGRTPPKGWKPTKEGQSFGDVRGYQLADMKLGLMSKYHQIHDFLDSLLKKHGGDARNTVTNLMNEKFAGMDIPGLKNKTARYTLGMLGGGNVHVPDTHFIRHILGLEGSRDSSTLQSGVRDKMWEPGNAQQLEGIDRWYAKNHPAVQHMLRHPIWGKYFKNPEDAIFPAFWKHWIAIAPHEKHKGFIQTTAENEGTTHKPFWDAIAPYLVKSEHDDHIIDYSLPAKTAAIHAQYVKDYGEIPGQMMYYKFLVPKLLEAAKKREEIKGSEIFLKSFKLDGLYVELRKAMDDMKADSFDMPKIYKITLSDSGSPVGRYMTFNNKLIHLEDYHGLLSHLLPQGDMNDVTISRLHGLKASPHLTIAEDEMPVEENGGKIEPEKPGLFSDGPIDYGDNDPYLQMEHPIEEEAQLPLPIFDYHRVGMDRPHTIEFSNGSVLLDGNLLDPATLNLVLSNIHNGAATLRYKNQHPKLEDTIAKMEASLEALMKEEGDDYNNPSTLLQHIRTAVKAGHIHPEIERGLTRAIYEDSMAKGMGNKLAYTEFAAKKKPGVYIGMDGNSFKTINDTYGHQVGDQAIAAFGKATREAMDEAIGRSQGKLFRNPDEQDLYRAGGDEFIAHVPSHEHAAKFARALNNKLKNIPPIHGVHKLSMAMGFGHSPEHADAALMEAKKQKFHPETGQRLYEPGQEPSFAHSHVPGFEGPIPLDDKHVELPPDEPKEDVKK